MSVRVIPFSFPPIKGGAQGGASPTPTPPVVIDPYDLSAATLSASYKTEGGDWVEAVSSRIYVVGMGLNNVAAVDTSDVAMIEITSGIISVTADGVEMKADEAFTDVIKSEVYTGSDMSASSFGFFTRGVMNKADWNTKMYGKAAGGQVFLTFKAYDNNGNTLQSKTWTAVIE